MVMRLRVQTSLLPTKILNAPNTLADVIMGHVAASGPAMWQPVIGCRKGNIPRNILQNIPFLIFFEKFKITMLLTNFSFCHNFLIRRPLFEPFVAPESGGRELSSHLAVN